MISIVRAINSIQLIYKCYNMLMEQMWDSWLIGNPHEYLITIIIWYKIKENIFKLKRNFSTQVFVKTYHTTTCQNDSETANGASSSYDPCQTNEQYHTKNVLNTWQKTSNKCACVAKTENGSIRISNGAFVNQLWFRRYSARLQWQT